MGFVSLLVIGLVSLAFGAEGVGSSSTSVEVSRPWEADCRGVKDLKPPKTHQPTADDLSTLKGCDAKKLYYGIGIEQNFNRARKCAMAGPNHEDVFTSEAILMMIYANGHGVKRNPKLALKWACELEAIRGEMAARVERLKAMANEKSPEPFDLCDDAIGSFTENHCSSLSEQRVAARREAEIRRVTSKWSVADRKAFDELRKVAEAYAEKRSVAEVDLSGEGKASAQIESEGDLLNSFLHTIEDLDEGKLPQGTKSDAKKAKSEMEGVLEKIMEDEDFYYGTVEKDDIRETQKKWVEYRDAWIRFGAVRYPKVSRESWENWLTRERTSQLKRFGQYQF